MKEAIVSEVAGSTNMPPITVSTGCSRYRNRVATPKLPPPPRIAQNRSGCESPSTCRSSPSAVTISAASRSSIVSPYLRTRYPMPPPRVMPPMPTEPVSPKPVASPWAAAAVEYAAAVIPVCAHAVRPATSMSIARMSERSSTTPPSVVPWPAPLWPPLRTASSTPVSRARLTTRATSRSSTTRTMAPGCRSKPPGNTARARS